MQLKASAGVVLPVITTFIVLWLGKALPKLLAMYEHEILLLAGYLLIAVGWIFALSLFTEVRLVAVLGEWRSSWLLWGLLLGPVLFVVSGVGYAVSARLGFSPPSEAGLVSAFQGWGVLMLFVLVISLAVLEEWLFRGVVFNYLQPQSVLLAVFGSAAVFSIYHLNWFQLLPTFLLGLGLALIVVYFGKVWPAVVAHALFNAVGIALVTMGQYTKGGG